jgi:hypothetical protein
VPDHSQLVLMISRGGGLFSNFRPTFTAYEQWPPGFAGHVLLAALPEPEQVLAVRRQSLTVSVYADRFTTHRNGSCPFVSNSVK